MCGEKEPVLEAVEESLAPVIPLRPGETWPQRMAAIWDDGGDAA